LVDALLYQPESAGIGQYILSLFSAYQAQYAAVDTIRALALPGQTIPGVQMSYPEGHLQSSRERLLFEQWRLPAVLSRLSYDVVHFPDYQVPAFRRVRRSVSTVHDLVAFKHPEFFPRSQSLVKRRLMALSVRAASRIIVPSVATAEDLQEVLRVPPEKIAVVPQGVIRQGCAS
jgi:glycosyltransferase involved in cell wall biosynthesis